MKRAAKRFPGMPKHRRAGHALRHDLGYFLSQVRHGFPQTRHGFAAGWNEGRQAHVQARAAREQARAEHLETRARLLPELGEYRRRQREALEQIRRGGTPTAGPLCEHDGAPCLSPSHCSCWCPECGEKSPQEVRESSDGSSFRPVLMTVRSKSGHVLNPFTDSPVTTIAVWDQEDLDRRIAAASEAPDLEVTTRPMPDLDEPVLNCDLCGKPLPPGYSGIAHPECIDLYDDEDLNMAAALSDRDPASPTEGNAMPTGTTSGDTTYTTQLGELTAIRQDAEEEVGSMRRKRMLNRLDILTGLGLDSASLSEAAAIDDALRAQEKAAQETLDASDAAIQGLKTRHGGIQEAVDNSPVDKPAQPEFYGS